MAMLLALRRRGARSAPRRTGTGPSHAAAGHPCRRTLSAAGRRASARSIWAVRRRRRGWSTRLLRRLRATMDADEPGVLLSAPLRLVRRTRPRRRPGRRVEDTASKLDGELVRPCRASPAAGIARRYLRRRASGSRMASAGAASWWRRGGSSGPVQQRWGCERTNTVPPWSRMYSRAVCLISGGDLLSADRGKPLRQPVG